MTKPGRFDALMLRSAPVDLTPSALLADPRPETAFADTCQIHDFSEVKWSWAARQLLEGTAREEYRLRLDNLKPRPGDVALVRVDRIGHHHLLETEGDRRLRLYKGDRLMCVFGDRYATDVYEGRVHDLLKLHLLTGSGLVGTVVARHRDVNRPTELSFLGYLAGRDGAKINLKQLLFRPSSRPAPQVDVILVVGTGMSTGKTTVTRKVLQSLACRGVRVAGCKLTGTASPRDLCEYRATGVVHATDFSDYGFPSTYGTSLADLIGLFDGMLEACAAKGAQLVVMEIADGVLQRETGMVLESDEIRCRVRGLILAAACSGSALFAADYLEKLGLEVWALSGLITNAPLFVREFADRCSIPVASSRAGADRLARMILKRLESGNQEEVQCVAAASMVE
jgi:hypothetical protein